MHLHVYNSILFLLALASCQTFATTEDAARNAFAGREGALVLVDCASGTVSTFRPEVAAKRLPPCSTFKIWNALIGLEAGILSAPEQPFYKWDGKKRPLAAWNKDLSVREAFQASCVPAFQNLARQIGHERMKTSIDKIGYGNQDISSGIDRFWLPAKGRKAIQISPLEQAQLIRKLVTGKLPFSPASLATLKRIMAVKKTSKGELFGKTGSNGQRGKLGLGWFVGYVESHGKTYAFACTVQGKNLSGKAARAIVERVVQVQDLL